MAALGVGPVCLRIGWPFALVCSLGALPLPANGLLPPLEQGPDQDVLRVGVDDLVLCIMTTRLSAILKGYWSSIRAGQS